MGDLLKFTNRGIYCEQANIYIDPWKPVDYALITHGHADHARWGHKKYLCHPLTAAIIKQRISPDLQVQTIGFGEKININGVIFSFHPAAHIIGSAQIRVEYKGEIWVASGDYKTENDGLSGEFEIVKCHTFITESTFGIPVYQWKPQAEIMTQINEWWNINANNNYPSIIYAYSLGKAQRIIQHLDQTIGPVLTHGSVENINELFRSQRIDIPPTERVQTDKIQNTNRAIIVAPPGAQNSNWTKKFKGAKHAAASGWMTLRGARRRRSVDKGFILSDHADWTGLNQVIAATGADKVIATHGYTETFAKWLQSKGINAITEKTSFVGESVEEDTGS